MRVLFVLAVIACCFGCDGVFDSEPIECGKMCGSAGVKHFEASRAGCDQSPMKCECNEPKQ